MRRVMMSVLVGAVTLAFAAPVLAEEVHLYRDDLFLGLVDHKVGCLVVNGTMSSNREYDGFTDNNYCDTGRYYKSAASGADYWGKLGTTSKSNCDSCGYAVHNKYGTGWDTDSSRCSYNVVCDCNSDCWMKEWTKCLGREVSVSSPCSDNWWNGCGGY